MYPAPFEYHVAGSIDEAIALLARYEDDAKLLAGGHSLIPLLKLRFAQPAHLIDVRKIPGLAGVREVDGAIVIGATTTHWMLESSDLLKKKLPIIPEAASQIGDVQVRNMGTIGGSLAHADPAADLPAVMLALEAQLTAVGPNGSRTIPAHDFFVGLLTSALEPHEVLTQIRIPIPPAGTGSAYVKYPHPASRFALVGVAAVLTLDGGTIERARVAITGMGPTVARLTGVEQALTGKSADAATLAAGAQHASDSIETRDDLQGSAAYKAQLARVYTRRALVRAVERARSARG
ncbi:MAG TPA: xanthine dehydrogenase family protein subunit M [Gemmatimonadaceae bacterium]